MPAAGYYHAKDNQQHDYYFDACGALSLVTCTGSQTQNPVAIQTWGSDVQPPTFPEESCAALGGMTTQSCHSRNASDFACDYKDGDGGRSVTVQYKCTTVASLPMAVQPDPATSHYVLTFAGPGACAGASGGGGGGGWGGTFLILFFVTTIGYFGGGFGYNYKYRDLRGKAAVPQIEYWEQLPGLVKDGSIYAYQQTSAFIVYLNDKRQGGPADPGLKRALAQDDGADGPGETAYEQSRA